MKKPILYLEHLPTDKKRLAFDFCYSAKMGAEQLGITTKVFEDSDEVPGSPTNIIVGSVEACTKWLSTNGFRVPTSIPVGMFGRFYGRPVHNRSMSNAYDLVEQGPIFVKPATEIKAFTGFVATDATMLEVFSHDYKGEVQIQPVLDIVSEYRCYVSNNKIVGMKHYSGDPLIFPNADFIKECKAAGDQLDYHSYVLDFGVLGSGKTILVEPNDGWAIGNYGLEPQKYYLFVRNRWLQLTGVRYRMDFN